MRYRPIDREPDAARFGRFLPDDWEHYERYPLSAVAPPVGVPVVIGVNWYVELDRPIRDSRSGEYFLAPRGARSLTRIRGGHAVCLEPGGAPEMVDWQDFYDQRSEGSCVGYSLSRCMSILNGETYSAKWLWDRAKEVDAWPSTKPGDAEGTSVRAGASVLRNAGHVPWRADYDHHTATERFGYTPVRQAGIAAYRWAHTVDEIHGVLGNDRADRLGAVPVLNSWGRSWPYRTWMPDEVLARLLREHGEAVVPTDR